ncbi:peptide chain release factor N(5)-glutamine methyltransferase [Nitriliruptoraceae bacterium ZYF776]|nr:peptide chain release factor N(5)-glutamine methyltransferase [Profundirhabdus halotolerans]
MTLLHDHLEAAAGRLRAAGVREPSADAARLAAHVLDLDDPEDLPTDASLPIARLADFEALVSRRAARVPLPHLVGRVRVREVDLEVGPGVFVPQPETEPVIAWAAAAVRGSGEAAPIVADLCCGAGTIAFCLAHEVPQATVHAVERDPGAVRWARRNAARLASAGDPPVTVHLADVDGCLPELGGQLTLVASNPPYVATTERDVPDPEVVDHDPAIALWAGDDGLDLVRRVERAARRLLRPGGQVVVEHSDRQGRTAPAIFERAGGWDEVVDHVDQEGRDRFVTARRHGAS